MNTDNMSLLLVCPVNSHLLSYRPGLLSYAVVADLVVAGKDCSIQRSARACSAKHSAVQALSR